MKNKELKKFDILGVGISAISMEDVLQVVENSVLNKDKIYISTCPVGTVVECQRDKHVLISLNSADLVTPDGVPLVWIGRLKGYKNINRVYGPDLMLEICRVSQEKRYRNYFYGSTPKVLERLQARIKEIFPNLCISGAYSPPFQNPFKETTENLHLINKSNSDILWVGLGSPKQDLWMYEYRGCLNAPVIIGVGAAFDFISGLKKQAPRWMRGIGLEWFFRLITEPRRLWKRYILGNALFLALLLKQLLLYRFYKKLQT